MQTIQTGSTLTIRFITDSDLRPTCEVIERKGAFVTVKLNARETVKRKIFNDGETEYIFPYAKYSMAPTAKP